MGPSDEAPNVSAPPACGCRKHHDLPHPRRDPFPGPRAYGYFGAADLVPSAERGSLLPALLTWGLALAFAIFGLYALSGARIIGGLPLLRAGLLAIASTYILRGLALFPEAAQLLPGTLHPPRRAVSSAASLLIGLLYAAAR